MFYLCTAEHHRLTANFNINAITFNVNKLIVPLSVDIYPAG